MWTGFIWLRTVMGTIKCWVFPGLLRTHESLKKDSAQLSLFCFCVSYSVQQTVFGTLITQMYLICLQWLINIQLVKTFPASTESEGYNSHLS
jgi:hypothetical protein